MPYYLKTFLWGSCMCGNDFHGGLARCIGFDPYWVFHACAECNLRSVKSHLLSLAQYSPPPLSIELSNNSLLVYLANYGIMSVSNFLVSYFGERSSMAASLQRGKTLPSPMSVLDMTLNYQMSWSFGECGVPLLCLCSQVHYDLKCLHLMGLLSMGQIELFDHFTCVQANDYLIDLLGIYITVIGTI